MTKEEAIKVLNIDKPCVSKGEVIANIIAIVNLAKDKELDNEKSN